MEARWGKCLGRYELVAELGRGAMGVVYKARDPRIDRFVAVKTVSLLGASPEEALEYRDRFFQEAQAVGRLVHPGIVTVFDAGEEPETRTPYIVMEYIDGVALSTLLSNNAGKLPLDRALQLTEELAEALDCAHGQGVVHRDIKPANILVTNTGRAKITDFGIAKLNLAHLTLPGHVLGTPAYMSPEQLNGEPLDGRSDLFSLGVILYSMVSGYRPFQGDSVTTVCFKLANHDPLPPSALDPELPRGVDAVIMRAMAKDPAERYQRGLEFALDVRELKGRLAANNRAAGSEGTGKSELKRNPTASLSKATRQTVTTGPHSFGQKPSEFWKTIGGAKRGPIVAAAMVAIAAIGFAYSWHHQIHSVFGVRTKFSATSTAKRVLAKPTEAVSATSSSETPSPLPPSVATQSAPKKKPSVQNVSAVKALSSSGPTLVIGIDYPFTDGCVSISSEAKVLYSHSLKGDTTKRLGLFQKVEGHDSGSVHLTTGEHQLSVHVQSKADGYDQLKTVSLDMASGETRTLAISFHGRQKLMRLDLR